MRKLFKNIKTLVQVRDVPPAVVKGSAMAYLPVIEDAFLLIENERISDYGKMDSCPHFADAEIDVSGKMIFPCWCDSHTHLVYAASREEEFVDRIKGLSYEEIARRGGGILNSAKKLRDTSAEVLLEQAYQRLLEIQQYGTGAVEIKSGYGLTLESELKMLRVIQQLKSKTKMSIKATFLGAHALPLEFKNNRKAYIELIINEMIPVVAAENLADYIDAFCEKNFFTPAETAQIIEAGEKYGLKAKIHTNQFHSLGGIEVGVQHRAISVDHLEVLTAAEIELLLKSDTMPTLLPTAPFFLNDPHVPPAREMINAGLPLALASDFNPGTTPSGKMPFVLSLACIRLRMSPEEVVNAATINGARAMGLEESHGSISPGKYANFFITKEIPTVAYLPYAFGSDLIQHVFIKGEAVSKY